MTSIFERIRETDAEGKSFWKARELSSAMGYSQYGRFKKVLEKAIKVCQENGKQSADHFVQESDRVQVASGTFRKIANLRLSRYACLLTAMQGDGRKEEIRQARDFFSSTEDKQQDSDIQDNTDLVFYSSPDGNLHLGLTFDGETFWTTQKRMAEIFQVEVPVIDHHLQQIFDSGELNKYSVIKKIPITAPNGKQYQTMFYNLDVIIAVGYRVNSPKATQFRIWATHIVCDFLRKGFVIDDERFQKGSRWSDDHFELLLERIREIRASERMMYQKITDIYTTAIDYQKDDPVTRKFYAKVQNKLHWALTGKTAAEIIYTHADATKTNMGLTSWKLAPEGKILKSDVNTAKNYLSEEHLRELNQIVSAYLDLAENRARRRIPTTMQEWSKFLDSFLELSSYPVLADEGKITPEEAKIKAFEEYNKYRIIQDREYVSDFDKIVQKIDEKKKKIRKE